MAPLGATLEFYLTTNSRDIVLLGATVYHRAVKCLTASEVEAVQFYPNLQKPSFPHTSKEVFFSMPYCVTETGYRADKAESCGPSCRVLQAGFLQTGGAMVHSPTLCKALLSPDSQLGCLRLSLISKKTVPGCSILI